MSKPLAVDLYCGLGGWTEGLLAEGYEVVGYDIEAHEYGAEKYPGRLVLQDVMTLHGAQFKGAALIVASPPCQEFSYMAMPWRRGKQIARALRGQDEFPEGYRGSRTIAELTALFDACFRIQREASEAAGRRIPMVVENVRGAEPWVGRARWSFGSYYLWGDVPALMPKTLPLESVKAPGMNWSDQSNPNNRRSFTENGGKNPGFRFNGSGKSFQSESVQRHVKGVKVASVSGRSPAPGNGARFTSRDCGVEAAEGRKGADAGAEWFDANLCALPSRSSRRKAASAKVAKIPFALSAWIARTYKTMERVT